MLNVLTSSDFWATVIANTTPVLFATLAANIMTSSGMFNLGIEGTMLICALAGVLANAFTGSLVTGMLVGILCGVIISFIFGYFVLHMNVPMNAGGVAVNLAASGGTVFVLFMVAGSKNNSNKLVSESFSNIALPIIEDIPFLGDILSGQNMITYIGWICAIALFILLYYTKLGIHIRAVGENQEAARSAGINVMKTKFIALALCGMLCALGGMYLSMGTLNSFTAGMVAGRGFLALAMDAIALGNPLIGWASSLLYGFSSTISVYMQLYSNLDLKLISAFPYLFILFVIIIFQTVRNRIEKKRLLLE